MTAAPVSQAWSWRHAVTRSGLPPTTRHVLLTLSVFMDGAGRSCFPSIEDLIECTGLGRTSVIKHLAEAVTAGWLKKHEHGFRGRAWRRSEYEPCWPGRDLEGGSLGEPPPEDEVVHEADQGGSPPDTEVVREVNRVIDHSTHHSTNSPVEREARAGEGKKPDPRPEDDPDFQKLLRRYPGVHSPGLCFPAWLRLDDEGRRRALARLDPYLAERRKLKNDTVFALSRYLAERLFDQVAEPADGLPVATLVRPRSDEWWALFWRRIKAGERVIFMLDQAKGDGPWSCAVDALPSGEEIAALVRIETGSEQFRAWSAHLANERLRLGGEACGKFIRVPSEWPPGHGPPEGQRFEEREVEAEAGWGEADR